MLATVERLFSHRLADFSLAVPERIPKCGIAHGLFERTEVLTLNVLDKRQDEEGPIVHVSDVGRDLRPAELLDRAESAFSRDELEGASRNGAAHQNRLKQAVRPD